MDKVVELSRQTPFCDEVEDNYDPSKEFIRANDYKKEVKLRKLKRSMWITHIITSNYLV